jgi:fructose-bisphosphate aldolase, class I
MSGVEIRLGRLFGRESGTAFVVAFDHGVGVGALQGAEDAGASLARIISCRPDAMFLTPGLVRLFGRLLAVPGAPQVIMRADTWLVDRHAGLAMEGVLGYGAEHWRTLISAESAVALGADALAINLVLGTSGGFFADNKAGVSRVADEAHRLGMYLVVEVVDWGPLANAENRTSLLTVGVRVAAELGADVIKVPYLGDRELMATLVRVCPVPVLVLGGPPVAEEELIDRTRLAIQAGARGVVYGRNIWQAPDPLERSRRLRGVLESEGRPG